MPRSLAAPLALLLGLVAALALAACGGQDAQLLPGETAREITTNLDAVQQLADEGDCTGAEMAAEQVSAQIEALGGVDRRLKQALEDGAERLNEVIAECEEPTAEAIAPAIVPEEAEEEGEEQQPGGDKRDKGNDEDDGGDDDGEGDDGGEPSLPPQAEGEGKGLDEGDAPPGDGGDEGGGGAGGDEDEEQSGGVSPGAPAGEAE